MNEIKNGQSVPEITRQIVDTMLRDVGDENRVFINEARIVLRSTVKALLQRPNSGGFFTRRELADALHQPPAQLAAFAAKGDDDVRRAVPSAFADGPLSCSDKTVLSVVAAAADKLAA